MPAEPAPPPADRLEDDLAAILGVNMANARRRPRDWRLPAGGAALVAVALVSTALILRDRPDAPRPPVLAREAAPPPSPPAETEVAQLPPSPAVIAAAEPASQVSASEPAPAPPPAPRQLASIDRREPVANRSAQAARIVPAPAARPSLAPAVAAAPRVADDAPALRQDPPPASDDQRLALAVVPPPPRAAPPPAADAAEEARAARKRERDLRSLDMIRLLRRQ